MPRFVAVDGEGLTRDDGSHDYTLLAASDGSYIETYELGGLSTEQCFEYLLDLADRQKAQSKDDGEKVVIVGFYTSYDVNMIFRDLPAHVLTGLWAGGMMTWRAKRGDYKQYRLEYLPNRMLRIYQGAWLLDADSESTRPKWRTFRSCTWWDCFQFFQMSFVKALKDWGTADAETIDRIASMKDARGSFETGMADSVRAYCMSECRLLVNMMSKVAATLEALELNLTSWYGAGSIASALFKKHGIKAHIRRQFDPEYDGIGPRYNPIETAIMHAYFGGRVETFAVGVVPDECVNYDVRSAYPAATANLPSLADSIAEHVDAYDYGEPYAIWRVSWRKVGRQVSRLTPFPYRHKKRIHWPHTGSGWYHAEEVRAAMDVFGSGSEIEITVSEGYRFVPANNERPFSWVPDVYKERAEYKRNKDPREKILKLGLNSLYGKCAQSIGGRDGAPPPYQCYLWAGMITADCRAKLLRAAAQADRRDVLAIATDGLFVRKPIPSLVESEALGAWESQTVEPGLLLIQPGVYATPKIIAKSRGFSAARFYICVWCEHPKDKHSGCCGCERFTSLLYAYMRKEWAERRMAAEVSIPETRFIGFGYALATGQLETTWRRWIAGIKTIHFSGTTSKSFDPSANHTHELISLVSPNRPDVGLSDVYVPRTRSAADRRELELQSELLASQPDLDDNDFTWRSD